MSTSTIGQYFSNRVEELISEFTGHTLIFFKGFGLEQIRFLITHPNSLLDDASLLHEGFLDLEAIDDRWLDLAASIKSATKPLVGFYEELLAIRQFLPRMKVDKIVVIENNILSPWVPCYFPYSYAEKLFDYWQTEHEPPAGSPLLQLVQMYGDVKLLKEGKALLLPATLDDERIEIIPFWQGCVVEKEPLTDDIKHIEVGSIEDWEYCLNMTNGVLSSALFLQSGDSLSARTSAIFSAANLLNLEVFLDELELYQEKIEYNDSQFVHVLQKYWGNAAQFRPLLFYKDPDRSQETEIITQGQIIAEIVDQCEAAQDGDIFSNIFITAPTGSGKSILFQIPAIYLAEKYNLVTIVVSPLIALMNDQVDQLQRERGISIAACINSSMSIHQIGQCEVNTEDNSFFRFYPLVQNKQIEIMPLLRFMELLGLATYEIRGGEKAEVFIRINDPEKLERLATSGKYTNGVLQSIQEHHRNNERLLTAFFSADMNDDERWELIEQYFLGNEEYVRRILHIAD